MCRLSSKPLVNPSVIGELRRRHGDDDNSVLDALLSPEASVAMCDFVCRITEQEIADAGRFDLIELHGIAGLVQSIEREDRREAPPAWHKVGEIDLGD
jgi:hypothetical protein